MSQTIQEKIINYLQPHAELLTVADVRVGLGYTSVRLDNGKAGVAWTASVSTGSCTHEAKAGTLAGSPAKEMLEMLANPHNALSRTLGLATANALLAGLPRPETVQKDVIDLVDIKESDHVAMVGFFGPVVMNLRKTGCRLDIIELASDRPGTISPEEGKASLAACTVAILTATSVVTGTIDGLLADLGNPRAAIILGPSSFMCPEIFRDTPVTHIAGARVRDASAVERIISEGGGTMLLKQYMDFETVPVK